MSKTLEQYKNFDELMAYCVAQGETLANQSRKMMEMKEEISHLKTLLAGAVPIIEIDPSTVDMTSRDEHVVAQIEIQKLRKYSMQRELTMEETKKLEIFTKVLSMTPPEKKKEVFDTKGMDTEALLKAIEGGVDEDNM